MNKDSDSYRQGYDQGFVDALCGEERTLGHPESDGERDAATHSPPALRESIAAHVEAVAANYPEDVFPADGTSRDAIGGTAMRHAYRNAARVIREFDLTPDEPAA